MIQVYKKNELFVIEDTITETIYPNLTREETVELLKKFDRDEPEDRCDFAIKEDNISFEYASIDDKDKIIADLETKLAESEEQLKEELVEKKGLERALSACNRQNDEFADMIKKLVNEKEELKQQLAEKEKEIERLKIYDEYRFELPYPKVKILGKTFEDIQELIDKWLKQGSKDKISFALEQLEQIRKEFEIKFKGCKWEDKMLVGKFCNITNEIIDNQIKAIKGDEVV